MERRRAGQARRWRALVMSFAVALVAPLASEKDLRAAEPSPTKWEQLFYPFPIVGAPPQLEQQVQLFNSYFRGRRGSGDALSLELGLIATAHLGVVVSSGYQLGMGGQPTGFQDTQLLVQYLAAGSLRHDYMVSAGLQASFPTAQHGLGSGDYYVGPFVYAAKRFFRHLVFELNLDASLPLVHGDSARLLGGTGLISVLATPASSRFPVYVQAETNATVYLDGSAALPPLATHTPALTVDLAPELLLGPFKTPISDGTRIAAGVFFNLVGDRVHARTYTVTVAFDIPNHFGY